MDINDERIEEKWKEIEGIINNMPEETDMLDREFICDFRTLYEVLIMGIKNRLLGIPLQADNKRREVREKRTILEMQQFYEELEGKDSEGWKRCNED